MWKLSGNTIDKGLGGHGKWFFVQLIAQINDEEILQGHSSQNYNLLTSSVEDKRLEPNCFHKNKIKKEMAAKQGLGEYFLLQQDRWQHMTSLGDNK